MYAEFEELLQHVNTACSRYYGDRLVSLAVFGSLGRDTARRESDVDLLLVVDPLPVGRLPRIDEFQHIEAAVAPTRSAMRQKGFNAALSPVIKTPEEIRQGSPLLLDMTSDARCLFDRDGFLEAELAKLRVRLAALGARRIWRGNAWYWDLKPNFQPGEVVEL